MSKNPPDRWARIFGVVGILMGLARLGFTYFSYRFQRETYARSQEERVLVQLSAEYRLSTVLLSSQTRDTAQGQLAVEVINLGQQPLYLKSVIGQIDSHKAAFYDHDPMQAEPMRRVEPGEGVDYNIDWPIAFFEDGEQSRKGTIEVETTKKRFSQPCQINRINVVSDVRTLLLLAPGVRRRSPVLR